MIDPHVILSLFHLFIVVPFFLYIFIQRAATPDFVYNILFVVGLFVLVYQTYKALLRYSTKSSSLWINLIHIFYIAPLIIYIGFNAKKTPRAAYELLGIITFGAAGYHLYNIIKYSQIVDEDD
jgi:hypothetical protein